MLSAWGGRIGPYRPSKAPLRFSLFLLGCIFVFCVYRARIQGITVDEAYVFNLFVDKPWQEFARNYDACNHVLHTALTKYFRARFGASAVVLRLVSLIGAVVYFSACYQISKLVFGNTWKQTLSVAFLTLNPMVLDFMVAARGYGLALGLFMWALYCACVYWTRGFNTPDLTRAGVLAGLAIGANLTFLTPAAALGAVLLVLAIPRRQLWVVIERYGVPSVAIGFVITILPLLRATGEHYYYGASTLADSLNSVLLGSLYKEPHRWPAPALSFLEVFAGGLPVFLLTAVFAIAAIAGLMVFLRRKVAFELAPFSIFSGTFVVSLLAVIAMHVFGKVPYPLGRTGLFWIPLLSLTILTGARLPRRRWLFAVPLVLTSVYLVHTEPRYFTEWRFDASTEKLMRRVAEEVYSNKPEGYQTTLVVNSMMNETAKYFRARRQWYWIEKVSSLENAPPNSEYYLLTAGDQKLAHSLGLQTIAHDPLSGSFVARRPQ